jgi:PKD repeat protein
MRATLGLLCGLALFVASSGCGGTARALVNDRAADVVVTAIRPTSGESGETVTFEAQVCLKSGVMLDQLTTDDANMPEFTWNFGGAASPNVSFEPNPTVVLRAGSATPYNATLTLTQGCLADEELIVPFTIAVAPLQVLTITGTTGVARGTGNLTAVIGTGVAESFAWDFGGAGSPSGSTSSNPTITFSSTPGSYPARLIVSNEFEAVEVDFTIDVI